MKLRKSDYKLIIIAIVLVIISLIVFNISPNKDKNKVEDNTQIKLLKDYSRFYTVNSCVYKYIVNLQSKNTDNLMKLLDEEYITNNNINSNNIYNNLENLNGNYTFDAKEIYYEELSDNVIKYYVYGHIIEDTINGYSTNKLETYYIVKMDTQNMTFNISPSNENIFKEAKNG